MRTTALFVLLLVPFAPGCDSGGGSPTAPAPTTTVVVGATLSHAFTDPVILEATLSIDGEVHGRFVGESGAVAVASFENVTIRGIQPGQHTIRLTVVRHREIRSGGNRYFAFGAGSVTYADGRREALFLAFPSETLQAGGSLTTTFTI